MYRRYSILLACVCILVAIYVLSILDNNPESIAQVTFETTSGEYSFICKVADTDSLRRTGLLGTETLDLDHGMLFIYNDTAVRFFTMKDMKYPLDIIFIDDNESVIHIAKADIDDQQISSMEPAQYVVEINQGLATEYNITEKTNISFHYHYN
jgi:uncharacterized membrane protein (UPF0127 family)